MIYDDPLLIYNFESTRSQEMTCVVNMMKAKLTSL